jgi:hypothetical protein
VQLQDLTQSLVDTFAVRSGATIPADMLDAMSADEQQLRAAIEALEAQRPVMGDDAVEQG